jgi:hypothetical protein
MVNTALYDLLEELIEFFHNDCSDYNESTDYLRTKCEKALDLLDNEYDLDDEAWFELLED